MPTDIKLDEGDGNHVVIEGSVLRTTASDLILDAPARRRTGGFRRALVHDGYDGLTINFNGDYPGGVTVGSNITVARDLTVAGEIRWKSARNGEERKLTELIDRIEYDIRHLNLYSGHDAIDEIRNALTSLANLFDAAAVPPWSTREEVENGDDMGVLYSSAEDLGFDIVYHDIDGYPPELYDRVCKIEPPPGTFLRKGSTVYIWFCEEG
ncbi:hypothetical protein [Psychrobacillus vulpis]|uniref:Uncharacterized protein n=1 Tax=Psychrobacillus vulpis TaxID=2325572 RepID=A0A544TFV9_9BACI|nr:hypothetical protein [Psychrobacillus vulpis]TQR16351.1 hypothetical protein FG384_18860 [Psychrobacillus vulpis]